MALLQKYVLKVTLDSILHEFVFQAPTDAYANTTVATALGISATLDNALPSYPVTTIEALLKSDMAVRRRIKYTKNNKTRYADVICAADKAAALNDAIKGTANFKSGTIDANNAVVEPLRAIYS